MSSKKRANVNTQGEQKKRVKLGSSGKVCFMSFVPAARKVLVELEKEMNRSTRKGKAVFKNTFLRQLIKENSYEDLEGAIKWLKEKYKETERPDEGQSKYEEVERIAKGGDYDPETNALMTVFKVDKKGLETLDCATLQNVAKGTPYMPTAINVYGSEPGESWEIDVVDKEMPLKNYAKTQVGFARDYDYQKARTYKQIKEGMEEVFEHLAPLSEEDLCRGVFKVDGITSPFGYFKGKSLNYTRPHVESAGLLSVNLNITGGPSEWWICSPTHWDKMVKMVQDKGLDPRDTPFWPWYPDLKKAGIRVIKVMQEAGEAIIVNSSCVHWVKGNNSSHIAWNLFLPGYKQVLGFALATAVSQSYGRNCDIPEEKFAWSLLEKDNVVPAIEKNKKECAEIIVIVAIASLMQFLEVVKEISNLTTLTLDDLFEETPDEMLKCDKCGQDLFFYSFSDDNTDLCYNCAKDSPLDRTPHFLRDPDDYFLKIGNFLTSHWNMVFDYPTVKEEPIEAGDGEHGEDLQRESVDQDTVPLVVDSGVYDMVITPTSGKKVLIPAGYEISREDEDGIKLRVRTEPLEDESIVIITGEELTNLGVIGRFEPHKNLL